MPTDTQAARPDLSALDLRVQLRIEVAECEGALTWKREVGGWIAVARGQLVVWARCDQPAAVVGGQLLPAYDSDPAAWGPVLRDRLGGVNHSALGWAANWPVGKSVLPPRRYGPRCPRIEDAVCLGYLALEGRDVSRYAPLMEES